MERQAKKYQAKIALLFVKITRIRGNGISNGGLGIFTTLAFQVICQHELRETSSSLPFDLGRGPKFCLELRNVIWSQFAIVNRGSHEDMLAPGI
jgi:hypothetical protein